MIRCHTIHYHDALTGKLAKREVLGLAPPANVDESRLHALDRFNASTDAVTQAIAIDVHPDAEFCESCGYAVEPADDDHCPECYRSERAREIAIARYEELHEAI